MARLLERRRERNSKLGADGGWHISWDRRERMDTAEAKHMPNTGSMDTRVSGPMLEAALVAGICSVGADAVCLGVMPTPAVAYLTRYYKADAG